MITRRSFFELSLGGFIAGCASGPAAPTIPQRFVRLAVRPHKIAADGPATPEPKALHLSEPRDAVVYVPQTRATPAPLVVMLHGAGGSGARAISRLIPHADRLGAILLAPDSRDRTWDLLTGRFGTDAAFLDRALETLFSSYAVDPRRIAIAGFSDGATYALTLGLSNAALFSAVGAFSPGFLVVGSELSGKPRLFITHGTHDDILPFERSGKAISETLRRAGYSVEFEPFEGKHSPPPDDVLARALSFLTTPATSSSNSAGRSSIG